MKTLYSSFRMALVAASFMSIAATPGLASDDFKVSNVRIERQPSRDAAVALLRQRAVESAVELLQGRRTGEQRDDALERRLLMRARAMADRIATVTIRRGPSEDEILGWWVEGDVVVNRAALEHERDAISAAIDEPPLRVMVLISERVEYTNWPWGPRPVRDDEQGSTIAAEIENELLKYNFDVISSEQFQYLRDKKVDFARLDGEDLKSVISIAKDQGCDVIVMGNADVTGPRINRSAVPGRTLYYWHTMPKISVIWQDDARKIAVPRTQCKEGGSFFEGPAGAREALANAGQCIGQDVVSALLGRVPKGNDPRNVTIEIHGAKTGHWIPVIEAVKRIDGVTVFTGRQSRHGFTLPVRTAMSSTDLMIKLVGLNFEEGFRLTAQENGLNTIELSVEY